MLIAWQSWTTKVERNSPSVHLSNHFIPSPQSIKHHMNNHTISFNTDGTAHCLWTEALPLHELGRLEITRASHIEFNNATQKWEMKDRRGKSRFISKSRLTCLEREQRNLQTG